MKPVRASFDDALFTSQPRTPDTSHVGALGVCVAGGREGVME